ncbi:MAG: serine/threonine protein kinase [bacterium]|nr:serine/threonine protein kinase [bacterium]
MAKSRIGPFALEAPLSAGGASGQVFRGIHLEQKKLAAVRVFPIPMGMTPESRQAYASQLEQLKQLRHPSIVRCYGGGFDTRKAYLAYQLVDGESLQSILERRQRLPWETAFEHSQQLAEGLQYAHQMGWVHGRLKPDKILVASDGTVKMNDWRRKAISSMLDQGSLDLNTQLFAAPEVLNGSEADEKSDLYSIGALMFYMLSGHPPFQAAQADQLRKLVLETQPPDIAGLVMDCPVWLAAIVKQLLSKEPSQRPYSATALQLAFKEAQRRQSEGVGVLQHATAGFSPLQLQADRAEAEKVLGLKKKRRKSSSDTPFFERTWVLLLGLAAAVAAIVWFLMPLSENTLRRRSEALLPPQSEEWQDWNEARDAYLQQLLDRFPEGTHREWAASQVAWVDARESERRLQREHRLNRSTSWNDAERQYWSGWEYEQFGDLMSAWDRYRAVKAIYAQKMEVAPIVYLADEGIQRIRDKGRTRSQLKEFVTSKLNQADQAYQQARVLAAREIWESIVELYSGNQELAPEVAVAEERLSELKNR